MDITLIALVLAPVSALLGAVIGARATIVAQKLTVGSQRERDMSEMRQARRTELLRLIHIFHAAAEHAKEVAIHQNDLPLQKSEASQAMWVARRDLIIVAYEELDGSSMELALELDRALWGADGGQGLPDKTNPLFNAFENACRLALSMGSA